VRHFGYFNSNSNSNHNAVFYIQPMKTNRLICVVTCGLGKSTYLYVEMRGRLNLEHAFVIYVMLLC